MKEDFPNTLLTENAVLPEEHAILSRLQTMLNAESHTERQEETPVLSTDTHADPAPPTEVIEDTETKSENMEAEDSSS